MRIQNVYNLQTMLEYFGEHLEWDVDKEDLIPEDYTYELYPEDLGIKEEEFAKINFLYQLRPLTDNMPFGIFVVDFESKKLEVAAIKKILSKLISKKRVDTQIPVWKLHDIIFLCFWGEDSDKYIGVMGFDDNENNNLPLLIPEYIQPKNEDANQIKLFEDKISHLKMPKDTSDIEAWKKEWRLTFNTAYRQPITDSKMLASELARLAKNTQKTITDAYNVESPIGYVHLLLNKFKESLVHDLDAKQFADMYAQTIAYGLFTAKCMSDSETFDWNDAIDNIPDTNPFLKSLIKSCFENKSGQNSFYDELELAKIIKLLDNTDIKSILDHFNRHTGGGREDTVIYFYEDFLSEYEHDTKKRRGVYYTPWQVVKFMVRAVDDILRTEFGFEDGLAQNKERKRKKSELGVQYEPAVQILDPATGTGTFLREIIFNIHDTFVAKYRAEGKSDEQIAVLWNEYVPKYLLTRLHGFELMMAPYAVAHMKLAMALKETGYDFSGDERLRVMLTNALEPAKTDSTFAEVGMQITFDEDPLATEAIYADKTKNNSSINVVIGNPPYSGISSNNNEYISNLINDYKYINGEYFNERKHWLNDDYVKFIRFGEETISNNGIGILAFINNNGFLGNPTFRCMRYHLLKSFDEIYIINLHGDANKHETCPDGSKDENVFDIKQGVSINIFIRKSNSSKGTAKVFYHEIYGLQEYKYRILSDKCEYSEITPESPYYLFIPSNIDMKSSYYTGISLEELFKNHTTGIVTMGDGFALSDDRKTLIDRLKDFILNEYTTDDLNNLYGLGKNYAEFIVSGKKQLIYNEENVVRISYRPFDIKYTYFDNKVLWRTRSSVLSNFINKQNIGIITARSNKSDTCDHFYITQYIMETKCGERTTQSAVFPLFAYEDGKKYPNLDLAIVGEISDKLGLPFNPDSDGGFADSFAPIDLLDYIYAVLHSPKYRETYKEFLKIDFPRVPYPTNQEMFWKMVKLGGEIRKIHLMESPLLDTLITTYCGEGENEVGKPTFKDNKVYINKTQYFDGVPELAWNFYIGGYQPLQKWLKDRKGRKLTEEELTHYQKIVAALVETDRLMKEIDEVFEF